MSTYDDLVKEIHNYLLNEEDAIVKALVKAEKATGLKRDQIAYGIVSIIAIYLVLGHGAELLCNFIGFAYPAYSSFKAIESTDKADDTQWLTYWCVFGTTALLDFASDKIMGYFPIYWLVKCVFLVWLYLPFFRGAERLYVGYFGPAFRRLRPVLEGARVQAQEQVQQAAISSLQQTPPAQPEAPPPTPDSTPPTPTPPPDQPLPEASAVNPM